MITEECWESARVMTDDVRRWLEELGLGKYAPLFAENELSFAALAHLTEDDLKELGLPLGPRRIVAAALAKRAPATQPGGIAAGAAETAVPRNDAERRQVTILFCDLAGSTELSTRLDPEDMRDLLSSYRKACVDVIARYDGYVAKFMGDGVLAYFGYPRAHEDDAERAINAGLGVVDAIRGSKATAGALAVPLAVRVGIATGPVVVGDLQSHGAAEEAAVIGETPNLAARLQAMADADTVVVADATFRLAGAMFECADLGSHRLKGFADPVRSWSVLRPRQVENRFDATRSAAITPLIGRDEEIEILLRRWRRAKEGQGQVALITGEAGIGKSRLVRGLQEALAAEPHTRLRYQCSPYHVNSALHPIIQQLERAAGFGRGDDAATKHSKLDAILALSGRNDGQTAALIAALLSLPDVAHGPQLGLSAPQRKERILRALVEQLVGLAERNPVLFLFEDAHWIDPTTLELLERTIARVPRLRALVVITHRPEFQARWVGAAHVTLVALNRLNSADRVAMVEWVTGGTRLPPEVLDRIADKTDGIPLFVEELTKSILESGQLTNEGGRYELKEPLPALAVPETLQDALMARIDRLASVRDIMQSGACIGREFTHALLSRVVRRSDEELRAALAQLAEADLISRRGDPPAASYTFKHALVQEAAYATLLRSRRAEIHGAIAHALAAGVSDGRAIEPETIARHFTEAGMLDRAIPLWDEAGRSAAQKFANAEAIGHFAKALELIGALPEGEDKQRRKLGVLLNLAPIYMAIKGFSAPEADAAYTEARELALALGDRALLFTALWGLWLVNQMRPKKGTARALSEELLSLGAHNADSNHMLQAHHAAWTTNFFLGKFAYTREHADHGAAHYDAAHHRAHKFLYGGHDPGVCSRMFGGLSRYVLGYPDQALKTLREGLELGQTLDHPLSHLLARIMLLQILLLRGDARAAAQILEQAIRLSSDKGVSRVMWADFFSGWVRCVDGFPEEGLALMLRDFESVGAAGQEAFRPYYLGVVADTHRAVGRIDDGLDRVERAIGLVATHDSQWCLAELQRIKGELLRARGEPRAAQSCFEAAMETARGQDAKSWELRAASSLVRLWQSERRCDEARNVLAPIYGWFTEGFDSADLRGAKALLNALGETLSR
jgi:class 3 adenylate cyclase/predicted ATPase